ncbi:MAG: hypothetical protein ACE5EM_12240 [Sphingomonadales bacterium]
MTDRSMTAAASAETEASSIIPVLFCELMFETPARVWSGLGPIMAAMPGEAVQTWDGVGDLGSIDAVAETADRRENGMQLTLSGIDPDLLTSALEENYQGRSAKLWIAFLDASHQVIGEPVSVFGGIMDVMSAADGDETGALSVQCESRDVQTRRSSTSLLTDQEQQRLHPGDKGLEFVMELQSKEILWGMPSPRPAAGGPPNPFREFAR